MTNKGRTTFARDVRFYLLAAAAAALLAVFWVDERNKLASYRSRIIPLEKKIINAKGIINTHRDVLLPRKVKIDNPTLLAEKTLRTVVKETTEKVGIGQHLISIDPSEDKKNGMTRARLTLQRITIRQLVEFVVALKNLSAGIRDTRATLRMEHYNTDRWHADLSLEAPLGKEAGHAVSKSP